MPCGCQNACGCTVIGDGVTTTAVSVGDTTTVSAIQTFLGVLDTPCINMSLAAGIVSATPTFAPGTAGISMACTGAGILSTIVIDPASTAPVSVSAAGLRVDCCAGGDINVEDTDTVDMTFALGALSADVIPNTAAGLENQAGGVSIKLQDDPGTVPAVCENRLRFISGTGDLAMMPDGLLHVAVGPGVLRTLPTAQGADSTDAQVTTFTNTRDCAVYATFRCVAFLVAEPLNFVTPPAGGRIISMQARADNFATNGVQVGAIGTWSMTHMDSIANLTGGVAVRFRSQLEITFLLAAGDFATVNVYVRALEALSGYDGTSGSGFGFDTEAAAWYISTQRT